MRVGKFSIVICVVSVFGLARAAHAAPHQFAGNLPETFVVTGINGNPNLGVYNNHVAEASASGYMNITLNDTPSPTITLNQVTHTVSQPFTTSWTDNLNLSGGGTETLQSSIRLDSISATSLVSPIGPKSLAPDIAHAGTYSTTGNTLEQYQSMTVGGHWTIDSPSQHLSGDFSYSFMSYGAFGGTQLGPLYYVQTANFPNSAFIYPYNSPDFYLTGSTTTNLLNPVLFNGTVDGQPWKLSFSVYFDRGNSGFSFYQLQPVPEPATIWLAGLGAVLLLSWRLRGRWG